MPQEQRYPAEHLHQLTVDILQKHGTSNTNALMVADALMAAQIDGHIGHGLSRVSSYSQQVASGKVDGQATPVLHQVTPAMVRIDASLGFAFPAMQLAIDNLLERTEKLGIAIAGLHRSHHFGVAGYHVEKLASQGLIGLIFSNSPKAIAPWGGTNSLFGTNPIAFAAPRVDQPPLLIDLSLAQVARGKIMLAAKNAESIPEGWALDKNGNSTTDAQQAMDGTLLPMGGSKGAALVLMVEILAAALTGANFGFEASSFFSPNGKPPAIGHSLIAIDPRPLANGMFTARLETLLATILKEKTTRLPGSNRISARTDAEANGVAISASLYAELQQLDQ